MVWLHGLQGPRAPPIRAGAPLSQQAYQAQAQQEVWPMSSTTYSAARPCRSRSRAPRPPVEGVRARLHGLELLAHCREPAHDIMPGTLGQHGIALWAALVRRANTH